MTEELFSPDRAADELDVIYDEWENSWSATTPKSMNERADLYLRALFEHLGEPIPMTDEETASALRSRGYTRAAKLFRNLRNTLNDDLPPTPTLQ